MAVDPEIQTALANLDSRSAAERIAAVQMLVRRGYAPALPRLQAMLEQLKGARVLELMQALEAGVLALGTPDVPPLVVRRATPHDLDSIAALLSQVKPTNRQDIAARWREKIYTVASDPHGNEVGVIAWRLDEGIGWLDECAVAPNVPADYVVKLMVGDAERWAWSQGGEVMFVVAPASTQPQPFLACGYVALTHKNIAGDWIWGVRRVAGTSRVFYGKLSPQAEKGKASGRFVV